MCEIEVAVSRVIPAILGISEANLHQAADLSQVQLPGCTLDNPMLQCSRVVVYLGEGVSARVREDLMSENFSSIWIEVSVPGKAQKILISNIYQGTDKSSKSEVEVMRRWQEYLWQWRRALESGAEVHALGDFSTYSLSLLHLSLHLVLPVLGGGGGLGGGLRHSAPLPPGC